jgi:transcriptional regulator with XRE-family HTH domain
MDRGGAPANRVVVNLAEIDRERALRRWTKSDLAFALGVSNALISAMYTDGNVSPNLFEKLVQVLGDSALREVAARLMERPA